MNTPKISVVMPVYNSEKYLREAIDSILNQTFTDFEFLIFNDGSSDGSAKVIKDYKDTRIVFFDRKENLGYLVHLNEGIKIAKGEYIARMDSDDISFPRRFEKQLDFMEKNLDFGVCGTQVVTIGEASGYVSWLPVDDAEMRSLLLFRNSIAHPTAMIRKSVLEKHRLLYDPEYYTAEDLKMWTEISKYSKLGNIPELLLKYRGHPAQIVQRDNTVLLGILRRFYKQQVCEMGLSPTDEELEIHNIISNKVFGRADSKINRAGEWILKLKQANRQGNKYPEPAFSKVLAKTWYDVCKRHECLGIWAWKVFMEWPLLRYRQHLSIIESLKAVIESLFRFIKRFGMRVSSDSIS